MDILNVFYNTRGQASVLEANILLACWFMSQVLHFLSAPCVRPGKAAGKATSLYHLGDKEETPGSWLQVGSAPNTVALRGVNQQIDDLSYL